LGIDPNKTEAENNSALAAIPVEELFDSSGVAH